MGNVSRPTMGCGGSKEQKEKVEVQEEQAKAEAVNLISAVMNGNTADVQLFCKYFPGDEAIVGADDAQKTGMDEWNALQLALRMSNWEAALALIEAKADVNASSLKGAQGCSSTLYIAAESGNSGDDGGLGCVKALLLAKADVNVGQSYINDCGCTPLNAAKAQGRNAVAELLEAAGGLDYTERINSHELDNA